MTEHDGESEGTLAERIAAQMERVNRLLRNIHSCRDNGTAPAETLRPEKRIDGARRQGGPGAGSSTALDGRVAPSISSRDSADHPQLRTS